MRSPVLRAATAFAGICALLGAGFGSIAFAEVTLNLPPGTTTPTVGFSTNPTQNPLPSFASIQFTDLPAGYDVSNETYLGWCANITEGLLLNGESPISSESDAIYQFYNTYPGSGVPSDAPSSAWPKVNWLLNHKKGASGTVAATVVDIQEAIWYLLFGQYVDAGEFTGSFNPASPTAAAQQLVSDAEANGANFVPGVGQVVAVFLHGISQPTNGGPPQDLMTELTVPSQIACVIPATSETISETSWNQFNVPQGTSPVVWVHAQFAHTSGIPTNAVSTVLFGGVSFVLNGKTYPMPSGLVTFNPSAPATSTTVFNATLNQWDTTINPNDISDENFFTGAAIPVTSAISSGGQATIEFTTNSSVTPISFQWQWSAAVFTFWPGNPNSIPQDYNLADIQPYHGNGPTGSQHADTPDNVQIQASLIQGPRGGGGSNYTGSWSATGQPGACQAP